MYARRSHPVVQTHENSVETAVSCTSLRLATFENLLLRPFAPFSLHRTCVCYARRSYPVVQTHQNSVETAVSCTFTSLGDFCNPAFVFFSLPPPLERTGVTFQVIPDFLCTSCSFDLRIRWFALQVTSFELVFFLPFFFLPFFFPFRRKPHCAHCPTVRHLLTPSHLSPARPSIRLPLLGLRYRQRSSPHPLP